MSTKLNRLELDIENNQLIREIEILDWGPREVNLQDLPNLQPNGDVGFWVKIKNADKLKSPTYSLGNYNDEDGFTIDGELLTTSIHPTYLSQKDPICFKLMDGFGEFEITVGEIRLVSIDSNRTTDSD